MHHTAHAKSVYSMYMLHDNVHRGIINVNGWGGQWCLAVVDGFINVVERCGPCSRSLVVV